MNKWMKLCGAWAGLMMLICLSSCAPRQIKNKAVFCRIRFDLADPALQALRAENQRAVLVLETACGRLAVKP